jgi:hypothetical protein
MAVWQYDPSPDRWVLCDDCITRPCSCNMVNGQLLKDDDGRDLVCCEFTFSANGFEK